MLHYHIQVTKQDLHDRRAGEEECGVIVRDPLLRIGAELANG